MSSSFRLPSLLVSLLSNLTLISPSPSLLSRFVPFYQAYLYFQIRKWYILAFLLSIALSSTVSSIYYLIRTRAKPSNPPPTRHEELFIEIWIKLPFSLYVSHLTLTLNDSREEGREREAKESSSS